MFDGEEAASLRGITAEQPLPSALPLADMHQAGFAVESEDDERAMLAEAYANYLEEMERTPTQLIVVPTFGCNLSCTYCYQEPFVGGSSGLIAPETIAALFAYIDRFHGEERTSALPHPVWRRATDGLASAPRSDRAFDGWRK